MEFTSDEPRRPRTDWLGVKERLRKHPGKWAIVDEGASQAMATAASRERGKAGRFFEIRVDSLGYGTGRSRILARYVGDNPTY